MLTESRIRGKSKMAIDELYLDNLDEFVNDENKIVSINVFIRAYPNAESPVYVATKTAESGGGWWFHWKTANTVLLLLRLCI